MACECFEQGRVARCRAVAGTWIPTHYERERWCLTDESDRCPTFRLYRLERAPISEERWLRIWGGPEDEPPVERRAAG
jgi:hypothetical protein